MGKSRLNRWWLPTELETEIRWGTWATRIYSERLLSSWRAPINCGLNPRGAWPLQDIVLLPAFCARIHHPLIPPSHLHCPHDCNTSARVLRSIRRPLDPPVACHTPYNIGNGNIKYKRIRFKSLPVRRLCLCAGSGLCRFVTNPHPALCSRRHLLASMFSCLSVCVLLSRMSSVCIAVGSTSLVCAVRSVSKTLAREYHVTGNAALDPTDSHAQQRGPYSYYKCADRIHTCDAPICLYAYTHTYVYAHYTHVNIYTHTLTHICIYIYIYRVHPPAQRRGPYSYSYYNNTDWMHTQDTPICMYAYTHKHIYIHVYIYYVHVYIYIGLTRDAHAQCRGPYSYSYYKCAD